MYKTYVVILIFVDGADGQILLTRYVKLCTTKEVTIRHFAIRQNFTPTPTEQKWLTTTYTKARTVVTVHVVPYEYNLI